jgi:hypothetical protein
VWWCVHLGCLLSCGRERQRGQISQHLREALRGAILREVELGCRGVHTRVGDVTSEIRKDVSSAMNEVGAPLDGL